MANKYCAKYICHVPVYKCSLYCTQFSRLSKKGPPFCNERTFAISPFYSFFAVFFSIFQLFTLFLVNVFKINFKSTIRKMHIESIPEMGPWWQLCLLGGWYTYKTGMVDRLCPTWWSSWGTLRNIKLISIWKQLLIHHHYDHSDGNPFSTKVSGFANYCW